MEAWITKIFLFFLVFKGLTEAYLERRNKKHIIAHRHQVPERFQGQLSLPEHQKAADYSLVKIQAGQLFDLIGFAILLIWTLGGGLNALDHLARSFGLGELTTGLIFFAGFALISLFLSLPQSLYTTFVIEERFGFNKTTPALFFKDTLKGLVVGSLIGGPLLLGVLWIMQALGHWWWAFAWAFFTLFQLILVAVYPTFIAPLFNKFTPLEEGAAKQKILELLKRTQFESDGLFVMDASSRSSHGNAYFTGFGKTKRIVLFDTLLKNLNPEEVQAVLAHELGHFKRKHILKGMIRSFVVSLIGFAILGQLIQWPAFYQGHGLEQMSHHGALLLFVLVSGVYTF